MKLIFLDFKKIHKDNGYDGLTYLFEYKLIDPRPGALIDVETEYRIEVSIVRTLAQIWGYKSDELAKILSEFAKRTIIQKLIQGKLEKYESLELHSNNVGKHKIFDPNKIDVPKNKTIEIEIEALRQQVKQREKQNRKIGFKSDE